MQLKSKLTVITSCDNRVAAHEYRENVKKRRKGKRSNAAKHYHLRRYQNLVKIELDLFYPKFSLNFLEFYFVKFVFLRQAFAFTKFSPLEFDKG